MVQHRKPQNRYQDMIESFLTDLNAKILADMKLFLDYWYIWIGGIGIISGCFYLYTKFKKSDDENLRVTEALRKAHEKRGWLARLIGGKPKPSETEGMTLEALIRFHYRLKAVGMTQKQIDQILHPLYESAGEPIALDGNEVATQIAEAIAEKQQGRSLK